MTQRTLKIYDGANFVNLAVDPETLGAMLSEDLLLHLDFQRWVYDPITPQHRIIGSNINLVDLAAQPLFVSGRWPNKQALAIFLATTNLCTNPSFEVNTAGWSEADADASLTVSVSADMAHTGVKSLKLAQATGGEADYMYFSVASPGNNTAYTITAWVYTGGFTAAASGNRGLVAYDTNDAAGTIQIATITAATPRWTKLQVTVTTSASAGNLQIRLYAPQGTIYWDSVQIEQKAYNTIYCDGDRPGCAWTGTPHASTSSRTAQVVQAPNPLSAVGPYTVVAWIKPIAWDTDALTHAVVDCHKGASNQNRLLMYRLASSSFRILIYGNTAAGYRRITTDATPLTDGEWHQVAATIDSDGSPTGLYIDGALMSSSYTEGGVWATPVGFDTTNLFIGSDVSSGSQLNGAMSEFAFFDVELTEADILALYSLQRPLVDSQSLENRPTVPGVSAGYWRLPGSTTGTASASYSDVLGYDANKLTFAGAWVTGQVQFECVFYTATGSVTGYAKLLVSYNAGANWYDVPGAVLSQMTGTPTKLRTAPLALPQQECLYKVQIAGHASDAVYCTGWALVASPGVTTL